MTASCVGKVELSCASSELNKPLKASLPDDTLDEFTRPDNKPPLDEEEVVPCNNVSTADDNPKRLVAVEAEEALVLALEAVEALLPLAVCVPEPVVVAATFATAVRG